MARRCSFGALPVGQTPSPSPSGKSSWKLQVERLQRDESRLPAIVGCSANVRKCVKCVPDVPTLDTIGEACREFPPCRLCVLAERLPDAPGGLTALGE